MNGKLDAIQKAWNEKQEAWEAQQDQKIRDLQNGMQTSQEMLRTQRQQQLQEVQDTASARHQNLMQQMVNMMSMLQKRPADTQSVQPCAKSKAMPGVNAVA